MKLGFIGAGNMASALARGIGEPALVADVDREKARALAEELGGEAVDSNADLAERADAVVLCHKPQQLGEVASEASGKARVVVSILAAVPTKRLEAAYPGVPVYRFIPNIPAEVRRGGLCYTSGSRGAEGTGGGGGAGGGDPGAVRPSRNGHRARGRAADRACDGVDELRGGLRGARGR